MGKAAHAIGSSHRKLAGLRIVGLHLSIARVTSFSHDVHKNENATEIISTGRNRLRSVVLLRNLPPPNFG